MKVTGLLSCIAALSCAFAFQAPSAFRGNAIKTAASRSSVLRMSSDEIGVTKPLGYWDPLGFSKNIDGVDRRWRMVEIKHGRIAMLATIGYIVPYYFKLFPEGKPGTEALTTIPQAGLVQIFAFIGALELWVFYQSPEKEPGDIAPEYLNWKRYSDSDVRTKKLNIELNNGRLAMIAIMGMLVQDSITDKPFPWI
uniref:Light harvesting complex protein 1 n=2 Tax=Eukaryota TaxID=2759 RepID=Q9ATC7_VAULI|nr:light harvesting complex protein 1 [Vaucheria litorea]|mmetsp:Transcript_9707/g.13624  ORF Transcript_9707/g.13624 Transcript_9707/m.13624 type:complete len:195 (-) Transcript_9707:57-641(-)|eukprot:CAMPEP_0171460846 /NCGR_PEP_ID=MMETSP0945-20130129/5554_1 /TAXON_ID=109269 /ORGANISM="Vaucheria litorea, Strain CCMP2940" /LENGTH=194 /DNA_ID=CAMNT_0011987121 /DNA_START=51 /DNA_END=635 /DNA_ORIENTATION=+